MSDVEWRYVGATCEAVLKRPSARNALDTNMIRVLAAGFEQARNQPSVTTIVIRSDIDGVYCAGGDMRRIRALVLAGQLDEAMAFFTEEFALNLAISHSPKPVVALVDGLCMGGGLGLSVHVIAIASDRAFFAMPEGRIGWFPDIGASYFLPRLPGHVGLYLGLTGRRLESADALTLGLVKAWMPSADMPALLDALRAGGQVEHILASLVPPPAPPLPAIDRARIDAVFGHSNLGEIFEALKTEGTWGAEILREFEDMSPESLRLAFELISTGKKRTLRQCLAMELEVAARQLRHPDFAEGVRAVLVDKDRRPRWRIPHVV